MAHIYHVLSSHDGLKYEMAVEIWWLLKVTAVIAYHWVRLLARSSLESTWPTAEWWAFYRTSIHKPTSKEESEFIIYKNLKDINAKYLWISAGSKLFAVIIKFSRPLMKIGLHEIYCFVAVGQDWNGRMVNIQWYKNCSTKSVKMPYRSLNRLSINVDIWKPLKAKFQQTVCMSIFFVIRSETILVVTIHSFNKMWWFSFFLI